MRKNSDKFANKSFFCTKTELFPKPFEVKFAIAQLLGGIMALRHQADEVDHEMTEVTSYLNESPAPFYSLLQQLELVA